MVRFTGLSQTVVDERCALMYFQRNTNERHLKLGDVLRNGAAWEEPIALMVAKASKNKFEP